MGKIGNHLATCWGVGVSDRGGGGNADGIGGTLTAKSPPTRLWQRIYNGNDRF